MTVYEKIFVYVNIFQDILEIIKRMKCFFGTTYILISVVCMHILLHYIMFTLFEMLVT